MDFNNMVDQVCMLTGLTNKSYVFKYARYIELEVAGIKIFYLQEDQFYGYIVDPVSEEKKIYNLKTDVDFANMLYDLNLIIDKGESPDAQFLFMFRHPEYHMADFDIISLEEKKKITDYLFYDRDEGEVLFDITIDSGTRFTPDIYVDITSENFIIRKISKREVESMTEIFGGSLSNICTDFWKHIKEYEEEQ